MILKKEDKRIVIELVMTRDFTTDDMLEVEKSIDKLNPYIFDIKVYERKYPLEYV